LSHNETTRFGPDPLIENELANKRYVDNISIVDLSCKVRSSVAQTILTGVVTKINWNQEVYDTDGMHDNAVNNDRITFNTAGKYLCIFGTQWTTSVVGNRFGAIRFNDTIQIARSRDNPSGASEHTMSAIVECVPTDFIEAQVFQSSGISLDFVADLPQALTVQRVAT